LGGGTPGRFNGALGPVFTEGICGASIEGAAGAEGISRASIEGAAGAAGADGADGISTDGADGADGISTDGADGISTDDIDDPVSLGGDGGLGSLGDIGNGPSGSGDATAVAIAGPNRIRFTWMPVAIAAVRIRCFVVIV